jgi:hypothetical protein
LPLCISTISTRRIFDLAGSGNEATARPFPEPRENVVHSKGRSEDAIDIEELLKIQAEKIS